MLVASTDVSVEGVHFRLDVAVARGGRLAGDGGGAVRSRGRRRGAGGRARARSPCRRRPADDDVVARDGRRRRRGREVGARVVGGDLSAGPVWSLAVTVLGWAARAGDRAGARPGDGLWVTGALGGARAALEAWQRGDAPDRRRAGASPGRCRGSAPGRWLARHGARAMIDLSDGLGADAAHLAAASGVALELELERVPVAAAGGRPRRARLGMPPQQFAAEGGEDYELLVALPATFERDGRAAPSRASCGLALTRVGDVGAGAGVHARARRQTDRARRLRSFRAAASLTRSEAPLGCARFP